MTNPALASMEFDPLFKHPKLGRDDFMEALGLLPSWAGHYDPLGGQTLREYMEGKYGMPLGCTNGGTVTPDFIYHFPGDPPYFPLLVMKYVTGQVFVQYIYGLVSFLDFDGEGGLRWYHGRMD